MISGERERDLERCGFRLDVVNLVGDLVGDLVGELAMPRLPADKERFSALELRWKEGMMVRLLHRSECAVRFSWTGVLWQLRAQANERQFAHTPTQKPAFIILLEYSEYSEY